MELEPVAQNLAITASVLTILVMAGAAVRAARTAGATISGWGADKWAVVGRVFTVAAALLILGTVLSLAATTTDLRTENDELRKSIAGLSTEMNQRLAEKTRVEIGTVEMRARSGSGSRGLRDSRVNFEKPFASPPEVFMSLAGLDVSHERNMRITLNPKYVDTDGFNYDFLTWADTLIYSSHAYWIAVAQ